MNDDDTLDTSIDEPSTSANPNDVLDTVRSSKENDNSKEDNVHVSAKVVEKGNTLIDLSGHESRTNIDQSNVSKTVPLQNDVLPQMSSTSDDTEIPQGFRKLLPHVNEDLLANPVIIKPNEEPKVVTQKTLGMYIEESRTAAKVVGSAQNKSPEKCDKTSGDIRCDISSRTDKYRIQTRPGDILNERTNLTNSSKMQLKSTNLNNAASIATLPIESASCSLNFQQSPSSSVAHSIPVCTSEESVPNRKSNEKEGTSSSEEIRLNLSNLEGSKSLKFAIPGSSQSVTLNFSADALLEMRNSVQNRLLENSSASMITSTSRRKKSSNTAESQESSEVYKCQICSKTFKSRKFLEKHARFHVETNNTCCKICGKLFYKVSLVKHILSTRSTHSNGR